MPLGPPCCFPLKRPGLWGGAPCSPPFRDSVSRRLCTSAVLGDGRTMEEDADLAPEEMTTQWGDEQISMGMNVLSPVWPRQERPPRGNWAGSRGWEGSTGLEKVFQVGEVAGAKALRLEGVF